MANLGDGLAGIGGAMSANVVALTMVVNWIAQRDPDFRSEMERQFDTYLGRLEPDTPIAQDMLQEARKMLHLILESATPVTRAPTLRRRFLNWLEAG